MSERFALALGGNLGDVRATFAAAVAELRATPGIAVQAVSSWMRSAPLGGPPGQPDFLNGALVGTTTLEPAALLAALHDLERRHGRVRGPDSVHHGPRTLDLDLLLYGERCQAGDARRGEPDLPHPRLLEREFVLAPLVEIAADWTVPPTGVSVAAGLARLSAREFVASEDPAVAERWCAAARRDGARLAFVPTMGALHAGHLELVRYAARTHDRVCVSVFVNPLQFGEARDFERYPRDFAGDCALLAGAGCDLAFSGTLASFFPGRLDDAGRLPAHYLLDPGPCAEGLEGEFRPGHFAGVATIVDRLFTLVTPDSALFGAKDFQQTLVVRDLARRRGGPAIVVRPTVREPSGLAMSSRNARLTAEERERATAISRALFAARDAWRAGERRALVLAAGLRGTLVGSGLEVEYAALRDPERWSGASEPTGRLERAVALVACRVGAEGVRLIDNLELSADEA